MNQTNLYPLIERIGNLLRTELRKSGHNLGLQPVHLEALHFLSICNRYSDTPMAVTDYLGATKGTVSQTLKVLETKGYLTKIVDIKDRRVQHLKVTKSGHEILSTFLPPAIFSKANNQISKTDNNQMSILLTQMLRELQRANQSKTFGVCNSCSFFRSDGSQYQCGLTKEPLSTDDSNKICREHSPTIVEQEA